MSTNRWPLLAAIVLGVSNVAFLAGGLLLARALAPDPVVDLNVVRSEVSAPPFYELVFDYESSAGLHQALLPDPVTKVRPRPFYPDRKRNGPHDVLGFRNHAVPVQADIIAIGDSQTYGWNVEIDQSWREESSVR